MLTDYKIIRLSRTGGMTQALVRVYEGSITTETEGNGPDRKKITRYRRSGIVKEYTFSAGGTYSDSELALILEAKLSLDKTRTPITPQA